MGGKWLAGAKYTIQKAPTLSVTCKNINIHIVARKIFNYALLKTILEFVGSHCGQEGQDCRCRTLESGKEPMWLLECGGEIVCNSNSC